MKEENIPSGANKGIRRVGRGEGNGHGKTSCRGHKGAGARSGYSLRAGFEGGQMPLFRKLPQRGFNRTRFQSPRSVVNLSDLSRINGDQVDLESLKDAGLVRSNSKEVKLLGNGSVDKVYNVKLDSVSKVAQEKIEAAGGTIG
ncbi:MAG: 50S ribosomal protein L15 [Opitutae bacterium]|nr:50S ribosomal protein L15 [Opitutae bacterium]|tara:strand:- start:3905 stop:4333 length:429 start_codon:yes stop_codon:yes gene_type:complete